jgi:hypothetical protein
MIFFFFFYLLSDLVGEAGFEEYGSRRLIELQHIGSLSSNCASILLREIRYWYVDNICRSL